MMADRTSSTATEPVTIVGSACRFPGGSNLPSKLWELLKHPVDLLAEVPDSRFNAAGFYHENAEHPGVSIPKKKQENKKKRRSYAKLRPSLANASQ
jgi:hybrid polyketide synthase/nonribosomal peptide synthetase ACE1